jgi:hypothetical protein
MKVLSGFALVILLLVGCRRAEPDAPAVAPPAPGTAVLQVKVIAEPKAGASNKPDTADYVTPAMQTVDYAALDHIVVWLERTGANQPDTSQESSNPSIALDVNPQRSATDLAAAVMVGQQIVFHNSGAVAAKFYSVSDGNEFDLGEIPAGATAHATIASPGLIEVLSDANQDPVARLYAAPSRWVQITRAGQYIQFRDLMPGLYTIHSWHPRLPGHEMEIDLPIDQVTNASIKVGVDGLPQVTSH